MEKGGKRRKLERLLKIKEEPIGGRETLSRLLGEPPRQVETARVLPEEAKGVVLSAELRGKVERVLDRYGSVEILKLEGEALPLYRLRIPELTEREKELLAACKRKAVEEIKVDPDSIPDPAERRKVFMQELMRILEREGRGMRLPSARLKELAEMAFHDMIGYGPLDYLIADDKLEDILVIGTNRPVYVYHSRYGMCSTNIVFEEEETIKYYIDKIARLVGRRIDHQMPLLDARLPDGSRINATIPPVSLDGPTLSIRKFKRDPLTVVDLMNFGTLSPEVGAFLWLLVHGLDVKPANILFAGGTGSGKTTLLNCATTFVPERERIISIEDTAELQLPHRHWVRLECRPPNIEGRGEISMDDLVKNALRMRPDRIIVGEVRGPEARTMFTAMNTGHDGALLDVSVVRLSDGRLELIGDLCESLFRKHSSSIRTYKDLEYIDLPPEDVFEVVSVGPDLRSSVHRVSRVWRRRVREGEKLVRLVTRAGHEIYLTHHHPLFVLDEEGEVRRKEAGELVRGDRVACMMKPPAVKGRRELPREALRGLSESLLIPDPLGEMELLGRRYRRVPNDGGEHLLQAEFLVSQNSHPVRLPPELEPKLSYLLGVLLGDGCVESEGYLSATFDDRGYLDGFLEALRSYLPTAEFRPQVHGGWYLLRVGSKILSEMLVDMFNLPRGEKSDGWRLPPLVLGSDDENLAHFLAGLFDADASVDPKQPAVIFVTKSKGAAFEVGYALQRLGMLPVVKTHPHRGSGRTELCRVILRGVENLRRFAEVIPLRHSRKREALKRILSRQKTHRGIQLDKIPAPKVLKDLREGLGLSIAELARLARGKGVQVSESLLRHLEKGRIRRVGREALGALAEVLWERARALGKEEAALRAGKLLLLSQADVYWDEVLRVEEVEVGERYVYDLTVEEDHNYEANGLLVSNCMGTLHANSAAETITRLTEPPMSVPPIMIPALDVVVMLQRIYHRQKGHIRRIVEIAEVTGLEGGRPQLSRIYRWNPRTDRVEPTGVPLKFKQVLSELSGRSGQEIEAELKRRAAVLEWMRERGIRNVFEVGKVIQQYYQDPEGLLKQVKGG